MLTGLITIIVSTVYYAVLNANLYTDRARMPNGEVSVRQQSPIDRLYAADLSALLYLQLVFAAISVITGILTLFGVKNRVAGGQVTYEDVCACPALYERWKRAYTALSRLV